MATFNAVLKNTSNSLSVKFTPTQNDITLKNTTVTRNRLDQLSDVSEPDAAKTEGSILVYQSSSDTYVLRDILSYDADSGAYKLDGGSEF
jgi:hypothetical protein